MNAHTRIVETNYTTKPGSSAHTSFRVVFLFSGKRVTERTLCRALDSAPTGLSGGGLKLNAAFCYFDRPMTAVMISGGGITSTGDADLEDMVDIFPVLPWRLSRGIDQEEEIGR